MLVTLLCVLYFVVAFVIMYLSDIFWHVVEGWDFGYDVEDVLFAGIMSIVFPVSILILWIFFIIPRMVSNYRKNSGTYVAKEKYKFSNKIHEWFKKHLSPKLKKGKEEHYR